MNLRSDNEAPVAADIMQAMVDANERTAKAYGGDGWTQALNERFSQLFETEVKVYPLATGTAANALLLAHLTPPYGAVFCHREAHIHVDECGCPEFYSGGAKLIPLAGDHGKLTASDLQRELSLMGLKGDHDPQPGALSITQATECGTIYTAEEIDDLVSVAREHHIPVHMDGARFANALATLRCPPADITWRAGVDVLSFATTKNGGMNAEAAIFFNPEQAEGFGKRRMKGGHLLSKSRFLAAQLIAYLKDDRWLDLAGQANRSARRIADALEGHSGARIVHPVEANEIFVELDDDLHRRLQDSGVRYHPWPGQAGLYRMVASFALEDEQVDELIDLLQV